MFIYLCQCEVGQEGLDDFLAAGIQLMIKGLVEEEEIIDQTSIKQNSYIDESSTKENHFYSDTDFMVDEKTDINSGCKLDEDKTQMNPIKPDIDIWSNRNLIDEASDVLSEETEVNKASNSKKDISLEDAKDRRDHKFSVNLYNRVMFEFSQKNGEGLVPLDKAPTENLIKIYQSSFR